MYRLAQMAIGLFSDILRLGFSFFRSSNAIRAENLVLRRQLAKYLERGVKARKVDALTRISLALFTRLFDWRDAVVLVRPATIIRWHMMESHLREILKCWVAHYNGGRPHSSLGPGLPGPPNTVVASTKPSYFRHRLEEGAVVRSKSVLGGLHHEYSLVPAFA